jgi:hypothetical protein
VDPKSLVNISGSFLVFRTSYLVRSDLIIKSEGGLVVVLGSVYLVCLVCSVIQKEFDLKIKSGGAWPDSFGLLFVSVLLLWWLRFQIRTSKFQMHIVYLVYLVIQKEVDLNIKSTRPLKFFS